MTRVSAASVKLYNPDFRIFLFCDGDTAAGLKFSGDLLLDEVDEVIIVNTPEGSDVFKNRFIKTQLRLLIKGDVLFLDSDILVRRSIDSIFEIKNDFGAAPNHSKLIFSQQLWLSDRQLLDRMGWQVRGDVYLNGGVLFYRDSEVCRKFAKEWHKNWLACTSTGSYRDQPSLNYSILSQNMDISILDKSFNAQFGITPSASENASVWHYYASNDALASTPFMRFVNELNNERPVDLKRLDNITNQHCPFDDNSMLKRLLIRDLYAKNTLMKYHEYALNGRWGWAMLSWVKSFLGS
jgi:lipopolysaccharide biosynthesis glycosyltransferase